MTRDELMERAERAALRSSFDYGKIVHVLIELGLIKPAERKTDGQMAAEYLMRLGPIIISDIPELLDRAGYKIVKA